MHDCNSIALANRLAPVKVEENQVKLILTVTDTAYMTQGEQFEISPKGLKDSKRMVKDGCVYAGSKEKHGDFCVNDILLPAREKGVGKRHFMIQYQSENNFFKVKDLGDGMGTFIRLLDPLPILNNYIVSFGDSHLLCKIEDEKLSLKFIDGPRTDETL